MRSTRPIVSLMLVVSGLLLALLYQPRVSAASGEQAGLPPAPLFDSPTVDGGRVTLSFRPSTFTPATTSFLIEVGSASGLSDLGVLPTAGFQTSVSANGVAAGTYYVRIRGVNAIGVSEPSEERTIAVAGCPTPPDPPFGFSSNANYSNQVEVLWSADSSGCPATSYVLEAGSAAGLADLAVVPLATNHMIFSGVPVGTYYLRVRGVNAQGIGLPTTPDRQLVVTNQCPPPAKAISVQAPTLGNAVSFSWSLDSLVGKLPPARVVIEAGSTPGAADLGAVEAVGMPFTAWGPAGTYWTRVRTINICGDSVVSNDVSVTLSSECVVPDRPTWSDTVGLANPSDQAAFNWLPNLHGAVATEYRMEVGTGPGLADVRNQTNLFNTPRVVTGLAPGNYLGRVRAANICGASEPSPEVPFTIGGACQLPYAGGVGVSVNGQQATFSWYTGGHELNPIFLGWHLEIGTSPGASDVPLTGQLTGGPFDFAYRMSLPPGQYYARLRFSNSCGLSNPSPEVEFTIPAQ